jgi:transcriptional regulator with XRE-family HTH domain
MWSAILIREARLRAGLTQQQLADRSGRKRSVIARWERGVIEPSLETFLEIIAVCGFDLPLELAPRDEVARERLRKNSLLSPERRLQRLVSPSPTFDPYAILAALERRRVEYVVIGAFARIAQGAEETIEKIEIVPSTHGDNPQRLRLALEDLEAIESADARPGTGSMLAGMYDSAGGRVEVDPEPAGTRGGYDDLRRAAMREPIGRGLRIPIASTADLARLIAALGPDRDVPKLIDLRRLQSLTRSAADEPVG